MTYFSERSRRKLGYVSSQVPITQDPYDITVPVDYLVVAGAGGAGGALATYYGGGGGGAGGLR